VAAGISVEYNYPFELYWEIDDLAERSAFTTAVSELLGPATTENMIEHIDYIVDRIGINHVGIGNDFNHGSGIDDYNDASEEMNLTAGLLKRGYSIADINKIWSGNFLRILDAAAANYNSTSASVLSVDVDTRRCGRELPVVFRFALPRGADIN